MRLLNKKALRNVRNCLRADTAQHPRRLNLILILLHSKGLQGKSGGICPTSIFQRILRQRKSLYIFRCILLVSFSTKLSHYWPGQALRAPGG